MTDGAVAAGAAAWSNIHRATSFESWRAVALAVAIGRQHALREACSNTRFGKRYSNAIRQWLEANGFRDMPGGTRTACYQIIDNLSSIETWRASLSTTDMAAHSKLATFALAVRRPAAGPSLRLMRGQQEGRETGTRPNPRTYHKLVVAALFRGGYRGIGIRWRNSDGFSVLLCP